MPGLNWTLIAEIQPGADWLSTNPTAANVFRFEHHNPPRRVLIHVAQTDGVDWLFEPRVLSSDRSTQILVMEKPLVFAGDRRLSLRYTDPNLVIGNATDTVANNWTVKIYAKTVTAPVSSNDDLTGAIAAIAAQQATLAANIDILHTGLIALGNIQGATADALAALAASEATSNAAIAASLSAIRVVLSLPTPTPTPVPEPAPTPTPTQKASTTAYIPSRFSNDGGILNYEAQTNGIASYNDSGDSFNWIKASFPLSVGVNAVRVGVGSSGERYLNGTRIEYSADDTNWAVAATISGVTGMGTANSIVTITLPETITARYWQISNPGNVVSLSEFAFLP